MELISSYTMDRLTKISELIFKEDDTQFSSFVYTNSTGLITSNAVTSSAIITLTNARIIINDMHTWINYAKANFHLIQSPIIPLHKLDYDVKTNKISILLKDESGGDTLIDIDFIPPSEIKIKHRVALNMSFTDFTYWLKALTDFYSLIARRGY